MALSGNKLLNMLENSGYTVVEVDTKKSANKTTSTANKGSTTSANSLKGGNSFTSNLLDAMADVGAPIYTHDDIAPVKKTTTTTKKKKKDEEEDDRKWFQKGAFEDGYQFGDVFKTLLGTATDVAENVCAGVLGMGEKALDAIVYVSPLLAQGQYYQNGGVYHDAQTQKMFNESIEEGKKWSADFIKKDLYDEEKIAKKIVAGTDDNSVLGEKSDALLQSGGQLLATAGLQAAGVPWFLTTGATSFGSQAEAAMNDGAGYEEAGLSAAVSAGAEILTEKLSGGIKFGGKTLDDVLLKPLTEKIANKAVKTLVNLGVDAVGEGAEEVVSGVLSNLGTAIYKEDDVSDLLFSEQAMDEYLESFIGGAVLGGIGSGVQAIQDNKRIHLTENEQKVVEHEVEKRTEGQTLTEKEKNKIRNEVVRDMLRGYISTDTIEEVLGGETYQSWKDTVDSEDALRQEYEELGKKQNATLAEQTRYNELHQQMNELKTNSKRNALKDQLGSEVMGLVQNDRLAESYNERSRRGQAYQADISQYDEKQRATIQKAIDSGILNNTNRTHEFVDMIAKITADKGVLFDFTNNEKLKESGFAVDGKAVNGYVTKDGVTLNIDSAKSMNSVVGHEITHVLEGTELYNALQTAVTEYAKQRGDYQSRYDALSKLYEGVEGADINAELTADLVGDYIFSDTDFVRNLSVQHRNVFQKIYDEIKYLYKVATAGSKEARELEKVKRAFEEAYRADGKGQSETKYSLTDSENQYADTFYSQMGKVIDGVKQEKLGASSVVNMLRGKGVKAEEIKWSGIEQFLEGKKSVTKQELQEFVKNNSLEIEEQERTEAIQYSEEQRAELDRLDAENDKLFDQMSDNWYALFNDGIPIEILGSRNMYDRASRKLDARGKGATPEARLIREAIRAYDKNESLMEAIRDEAKEQHKSAKWKDYTLDGGENYREFLFKMPGSQYTNQAMKAHWGSKNAGVLAHARVQDFTHNDAPVLFIEEIQSDWHNAGQKFGYGDRDAQIRQLEKEQDEVLSELATMQEVMDDYNNRSNQGEYIEDYYEMYDLYNELNTKYEDYNRRIRNIRHGNYAVAPEAPYSKNYHEFVLKNLLRKAAEGGYSYLAWTPAEMQEERWSSDYAEGYRIEYEQDIPKFLNKYGKQWGAHTEDISLDGLRNVTVHAIPVTDAMKQAVLYEGQPKYSLSDSDGKQLTKEQQEYFKDSKVRDENGSLLKVYHGSKNSGFNVFRYSKDIQTGTDYGEAYYFTSDRQKASGYSYDVTKDERVAQYKTEKDELRDKFLQTRSEEDKNAFLNYKLDGKDLFDLMGDESYLTEGGEVKEVYLNLTNPLIADAGGKYYYEVYPEYFEQARASGNDGIIVKNVIDNPRGEARPIDTYIAFHQNQIKSTANVKPTRDADIRYSLSELDNTYQYNIENEDMIGAELVVEQAANLAMPDSKIRDKSGNLKPVYHGTQDMFYVFDTSVKGGKNGTAEGFGIYTSDDPEVTAAYGDRQIKMFANITKPARSDKKTITPAKLAALIKDTCKRQAQKFVDDGEYDSVKDALMDTWVSNYVYTYDIGMERSYREVAKNILQMNDSDMSVVQEVMAGIGIRDYAEASDFYRNSLTPITGFDGFVTEWKNSATGKSSSIILALNSNQLKSADAVTYDDSGNVVPLSERFNPQEADIRRSLSNVGEEANADSLSALKLEAAPVSNATPNAEGVSNANSNAPIANESVGELFPDDAFAPIATEDIAPVAETKQSVPMKAPTAVKAEAIRQKRQTTGPKLARATPAEQARMAQESQKVAKVLTDEPKVDPKKPKAWNLFKDNVVDKGTVFETMSLKSGNRELQGKWKAIGRAESSAQWFMEHGSGKTKSLKSIKDAVEKSGKTKKFSEYLYHMHNVDRMNLEDRFPDVENKPVFGYGVTSDMSKAEAARLEKANPEFKRWAQDVYAYNKAQRQMLVDNGVISKETAELWEKMYPHYVPVRRVGDEGLNINVALDSNKTGVNAPVKRATGGNRDILPLFDTMAMRTEQTFKAIAKNRFGVELKNMLGTTIDTGEVSVDEMIDSVDMQDSLLQEGKDGNSPTFTVFENGERVTFEITEEMYDTMKPKGKLASYSNKVLNTANNIRRGLLTEYNPAFMLTNPIKDMQDVLMNSQHPARTYANVPKAIGELLGRNGQYYQEYMEHGGEQNTFFDGETKTFTKEKSGLSKAIGFPLEAISKVNNFIERVPRMAEYIASRKMGRSIDVSMLDAARVTTDFSAGGDAVKMLNRNGFTFLNASVQGAVQQVRNVREAKAEGLKGWAKLAAKTAVAGLSAELLNHLLWEDDEDYEDLSDYVKQNYYVVAKYDDGKFVRIPKGRTVAVIQDAFEQMKNLITGDDETDFGAFAELVISNLAPNNPLENNLIAPIMQTINNETWYGDELVPSRLQDLPAAEQYDETTDSLSKWLGEKTNISPYKLNYLLDQYSGAIGDIFLPMLTPEAERGNDDWWGDLIAPISDKFTTDSVLKNQNVTDFYDKRDELEVISNGRNATKDDELRKVFVDAVSWEMSDLYAQKREIQNSDMSDSEKYEAVRELQKKIDALAAGALAGYEDVYSSGAYAEVGDRRFNYDKDKDTWYEIKKKNSDGSDNWYYTQEQLFRNKLGVSYSDYWNGKFDPATDHVKTHYGEMNGKRYNYSEENNMWYEIRQKNDDGSDNWYYQKEQEVTKALGLSYPEYWDNREEYNFAFDHPQSYALAKSIGGYKAYMPYYDALENWQSDNYIASDKDANGDTIYNSRKKKVQAYLRELDIPEMDKLLLYKSVYNSYDDRNYEIIDYLNNNDDLTFEDRVNALRGLGFTVTDDGYISWK